MAVPIAATVAARVGALVAEVREGLGAEGGRVRWVQMEGLHVTLRFLGPTAPDRVAGVGDAVAVAAGAVGGPFEVRLGSAGAFPDAGRPRALWLGIRAGAEELGRLSASLTSALTAAGWPPDERPFRPHLTIARTDGVHAGAEAGQRLVAAAAELDLAFEADRIVLFRSHLGHGPARYEALRSVALG
ncbi:MAG: RNA 2',3'-cyclic phosphodiesterase [Chloroflexi bacterium]|nr:RNA 2',3'-cyclic phosphodiesterase [Chloroflexota bacterium]